MIDNNKVKSGTYTGESEGSFAETKDGTTLEGEVTFDTKQGLRGRVGVRLMDAKQNYYGLANLWVDLTNNTSINVGKDKLQESYDKIWLEIGIGGQREVKKDSYLYADARLEKGLNRFGVKGTIGIKKSW